MMTARRHFSRESCSFEDLDRDATRKAEAMAIAKERIAQGRWIWTLSIRIDERELKDVAPPGSSEVQHL
jgi:hypothetical protein